MMKIILCSACLLLGGIFLPITASRAFASELVYQPINPSFGGNPSNGPQLLNEAAAQNNFAPPKADPLTTFTNNLNSQMLNRLSSKILNAAFGSGDGIQPGHYQMGSYTVDVTEDPDGLGFTVNIVDTRTNNQSTVQIPYQ